MWSNAESLIYPFGYKNSFTYRGPTIFNVLPENIRTLDSEKRIFLQLNNISLIKLILMRCKLLINLLFIYSLLYLSLSEFNQQIVYINFVWVSYFCLLNHYLRLLNLWLKTKTFLVFMLSIFMPCYLYVSAKLYVSTLF